MFLFVKNSTFEEKLEFIEKGLYLKEFSKHKDPKVRCAVV